MKERTKKYLKLSLILYVVILCIAVVGTLAWFDFNREVEIAPQDEAKIMSGKNLDICVVDAEGKASSWGNSIEIDKPEKMPDISMNPDGTFWYPKPSALDKNDNIICGKEGKGCFDNVTDKDGYFVKIPLKVRANKALSVYLDDSSFVKGISIVEGETSTTSQDAIAGAARVAFFEGSTLKTVWVPNENYQLGMTADGGFKVDLTGKPEGGYKYLNVVDDMVPEGRENLDWDSRLISVGDAALVSGEGTDDDTKPLYVNEATPLLTFDEAGEKELTVYVWIEGTDREAKTALAGGTIAYELMLIGVEAKAEPLIDINAVTYDSGSFFCEGENVNTKILYSVDGEKWTIYGPNNPNVADIKYICVAETATEKRGPSREFTVS